MKIKIFESSEREVVEKAVNDFILFGDFEVISLQYQPISLAPDPVAGWNTEYLYTVMIQYKKTR